MAEQAEGRNGADTAGTDGAATDGAATDGAGPAVRSAAPPRSSVADRMRFGVRTALNLLAIVAEVVAFACVAVLLVRVGLVFVPVNPQNLIVRWIDGLGDAVVLAFRDLFLPADPRMRLAVNYGVAAVFWLIVGLVAARVLRGLARWVAGRTMPR